MAFWETVLGKYIMTMAIAAVPVVELRGAIPAGIAAGLDPWLACGAAIFGNLLPVPFIILLVRQVFDRLRKHAFFAPWWCRPPSGRRGPRQRRRRPVLLLPG